MIAWLRQAAEDIVYGPEVVSFSLGVVLFQIVVLVMAVRRRRHGAPLPLKVHAIAGAAIAVLAVVLGLSVHAARALTFDAMTTTKLLHESYRGPPMWRSMGGQMSTIPFAINVIGAALGVWFVGATSTLSPLRADGRSRGFPPVALVGVGLLPIAIGAVQWNVGLSRLFAYLDGISPEHQQAVMSDALDAMRAELRHYARVSMAAIPILAVIAVALTGVLDRSRDRNRDATPVLAAHPRSPRLPLVLSASALLLAALLALAARPMAAENTLPWPPRTEPEVVFQGAPPTPDLVGPDVVLRAPVISVHRDGLGLNGTTGETFDSLQDKLITLHNGFHTLYPGDDFFEVVLILADPATSIGRLTSTLRAIRSAGYHRPVFTFARTETLVRPVLGKLERTTATGARIKLAFTRRDAISREWKDAARLRLQDFADYGAFARRLVDLRRAGKPVIVKVDRMSR